MAPNNETKQPEPNAQTHAHTHTDTVKPNRTFRIVFYLSAYAFVVLISVSFFLCFYDFICEKEKKVFVSVQLCEPVTKRSNSTRLMDCRANKIEWTKCVELVPNCNNTWSNSEWWLIGWLAAGYASPELTRIIRPKKQPSFYWDGYTFGNSIIYFEPMASHRPLSSQPHVHRPIQFALSPPSSNYLQQFEVQIQFIGRPTKYD